MFPVRELQTGLPKIFPIFVDRINDELWEKVLKNIISWYFDAMSSKYLETKIVAL
ncbi:hypothetical protein [Lysinibacillus sp. Y5S-8]|uniref:hypothetical protein n=1 Tax=Lysinibacillus sp. Y5S-8 TaxID=3122488 RepID=UPI0030D2936B